MEIIIILVVIGVAFYLYMNSQAKKTASEIAPFLSGESTMSPGELLVRERDAIGKLFTFASGFKSKNEMQETMSCILPRWCFAGKGDPYSCKTDEELSYVLSKSTDNISRDVLIENFCEDVLNNLLVHGVSRSYCDSMTSSRSLSFWLCFAKFCEDGGCTFEQQKQMLSFCITCAYNKGRSDPFQHLWHYVENGSEDDYAMDF